MKKSRGKAPSQRFSIDNSGITFEYRGFSNYLTLDASIEEKILNALRIELKDNQIMTYFNIKRDDYLKYVQGTYNNVANLRFLLSTLPLKLTDVKGILIHIESIISDIKKLKESGRTNKEIGKQYSTGEDIINRLFQTYILEKPVENKTVNIKRILLEEIDNKEETNNKKEIIKLLKEKENLELVDVMSDFTTLLGYTASNFDFEKIDRDIKGSEGKYKTNKDFLEHFNYTGIESIVFVRQQILGVRRYNKDFYPSEDIILETQYSKLGNRVVELMSDIIPNYEVRDYTEYIERLKELKRGKVHPKNSFGLLKEEKHIIREVLKRGYPLNNRFLPWYTIQEVQNFALFYGYTEKEPTNPIEYLDICSIDLEPYVELVKGYKEIKYHDIRWTTNRHNFLKEEYKERGPEVINEIKWCTRAECLLRVKQFSIKQRYSEDETQRIIEVFRDKGYEGLKEEFPNRTEKALRYKIEGLCIVEEPNNISLEDMKAEVLEELREEEIQRIRKEETSKIRKYEIDKIKKELEREVTIKVEEKLRKQLDYSIRKEIEPLIKEREEARVNKDLTDITDNLLTLKLLRSVNHALTTTLPKDFGTTLVSVLYDDIKSELELLFQEKFGK